MTRTFLAIRIPLLLSLICSFGLCFSTSTIVKRNRKVCSKTCASLSTALASAEETPPGRIDDDEAISFLDEALKGNATAASALLEEVRELREKNQTTQVETFLSRLLMDAVDSPLPWWSRVRPLARLSRRARRRSLRRVLDMSTPKASEEKDDQGSKMRSQRLALVILLRSLVVVAEDESTNQVAIRSIEKKAQRESKTVVSSDEMVKRTPEGLETPKYDVLEETIVGFEIRRYKPFSVCSVNMAKPREQKEKTDAKISNPQLSGASAFGALAGFIFGKNEESTSMKMTTPVFTEGEGDDRQMSFVMPSAFWEELRGAPTPLSGSGVTLNQKPGEERAVVMFGGFAGKKDVETKTNLLLSELGKNAEWSADPEALVSLAQYNDPFTPPWKRRNELSVKVIKSDV